MLRQRSEARQRVQWSEADMAAASMSMDAKVDDVEARLRTKIESLSGFADEETQAMKLDAIFRHFDADKSGWIAFDEFNAALVRLNFVGLQKEVTALFDRYDEDGSGVLSYSEFSSGLFNLRANVAGNPETRSAVERVRRVIADRGGLNGIRTLARIMRTMDDSGNRRLDRDEFKTGLKDYGLDLPDKDFEKVLNAFDVNKDGVIDFDEFLRGMRGKLNRRRRELIMMAYDVLDKDGSGLVERSDIEAAYDLSENPDVISGKCTAEEALTMFMSQWETGEADGKVTREEFLDYYKDVSASVDDDDYFELMIRNAWHISGGEGAYENTANRRVLVVHSDGSQEVVEIKDDLGLGPEDVEEMKRRLEKQGVKDIARISLAD